MRYFYGPYDGQPFPTPESLFGFDQLMEFILQYGDQALKAMASRRPGTARELLAISGIGTTTVEKYGQQIYRIVKDNIGW